MKVLYSVKLYQMVIVLIFNSHTLVRLEVFRASDDPLLVKISAKIVHYKSDRKSPQQPGGKKYLKYGAPVKIFKNTKKQFWLVKRLTLKEYLIVLMRDYLGYRFVLVRF